MWVASREGFRPGELLPKRPATGALLIRTAPDEKVRLACNGVGSWITAKHFDERAMLLEIADGTLDERILTVSSTSTKKKSSQFFRFDGRLSILLMLSLSRLNGSMAE